MKTKHHQAPVESLPLLREAASLGPGYKGVRNSAHAGRREELQELFSSHNLEPPDFLIREHTWIDRKAKLFESGEYPDKGLTVTDDHLQGLQQAFDLPVPLLIEHSKSPLEIGYLTDVSAQGHQLFGNVTLTKEANDLIEKSGAHALSLGLDPDMTKILEVSLVQKPRIKSARLFTGEVLMAEPDWKEEFLALKSEKLQSRLFALVSEGRLTPAQLPYAKALSELTQSVTFDGETVPVAQVFLQFLDRSPQTSLMGELAPALSGSSVDPEARAFYDRYFPGLSMADIVKNSEQTRIKP